MAATCHRYAAASACSKHARLIAPYYTSARRTAGGLRAASPAVEGEAYPHVSVLLEEVLQSFRGVQLKTYLDCTLGAGGHAAALAKEHPEMTTLLGIDLDPTAHSLALHRLAALGRNDLLFRTLRGNYSQLGELVKALPEPLNVYGNLDGILMDLGVSSMQIDTAERGFSFISDGPLDMRMDPTAKLSAEDVINTWSESELGRIIRDYGEEKLWKVVARRIVEARETEPIRTTQALVKAIGSTHIGNKSKKGKTIHPATRTFQALRIAVNDELRQLEQALPVAIEALASGGRLAVISFHSLEDRLVKHAFLRAAGRPTPEDEHFTYGPGKYEFLDQLEASKVAKLVTRKPLEAAEAEVQLNPRCRSAKLRVLEKL